MALLDLLTLLSYAALNFDIILQIKQLRRTKSAKDLSILGLSVRFAAIIIILIKLVAIADRILIIGQVLILMIFSIYYLYALSYQGSLAKSKARRR